MATYRYRHYTQLTPHATHHNTQHPTPSIYLCCFGYYYPSVETHFAVLAQTYVTSCLPFPCFSIVCVSAGVSLIIVATALLFLRISRSEDQKESLSSARIQRSHAPIPTRGSCFRFFVGSIFWSCKHWSPSRGYLERAKQPTSHPISQLGIQPSPPPPV